MNERKQVLILLASYFFYYMSKNTLVSMSAYFIDTCAINKTVYATSKTASYVVVFLARFLSGFLLRNIKRFNVGVFAFAAIPSMNLALLITMSACSIWGMRDAFKYVYFSVFCGQKMISSFARVTLIHLLHTIPSADLGLLSTITQVLSALADASGKIFVGLMIKLFLSWEEPLCISSITSLLAVLVLTPFFVKMINAPPAYEINAGAMEKQKPPRLTPTRNLLDLRFVLCCVIHMLNSVCIVVMSSYSSHFTTFGLGFDGADATTLDGIAPIIIAPFIIAGGLLMRKVKANQNRLFYVVFLPFLLVNIVALGALQQSFSRGLHRSISLFFLVIVQFALTWTATVIEGAYLMLIVSKDLAAVATGIISGLGYLSCVGIPFALRPYSTSIGGWQDIIITIIGVQVLTIIPLLWLSLADRKFMQEQKIDRQEIE